MIATIETFFSCTACTDPKDYDDFYNEVSGLSICRDCIDVAAYKIYATIGLLSKPLTAEECLKVAGEAAALKKEENRKALMRERIRQRNAKNNLVAGAARKLELTDPTLLVDTLKRRSFLFRTYLLSFEEYKQLYDTQKGLCAVCNLPGKLVVDHDHQSCKVRGLIHSSCNAIIGFADDEIERLKGAIAYLERSKL